MARPRERVLPVTVSFNADQSPAPRHLLAPISLERGARQITALNARPRCAAMSTRLTPGWSR
jgi:hypothetical protein